MSSPEQSMSTDPRNFIYPMGLIAFIGLMLFLVFVANPPVPVAVASAPTKSQVASAGTPIIELTATQPEVTRSSATATLVPPTATATTQTVAVAMVTNYDPALVAKGQQLFALCAACHGPDAKGITGLGKDLTASEFVTSQTDEQLLAFVKQGRASFDPANTTGIDMPPKGGNPALKDDEIMAIIAYLRTLGSGGVPVNNSAAVAVTATPTPRPTFPPYVPPTKSAPTTPTTEPTAVAVAATGNTASADVVAKGQQLYALCAACHGPDAKGITGLGKDLTTSEFVASQTDAQLLAFVKQGRASFDPANTTGIDMPPKGGNPALKDDEIMAIIAYLRTR